MCSCLVEIHLTLEQRNRGAGERHVNSLLEWDHSSCLHQPPVFLGSPCLCKEVLVFLLLCKWAQVCDSTFSEEKQLKYLPKYTHAVLKWFLPVFQNLRLSPLSLGFSLPHSHCSARRQGGPAAPLTSLLSCLNPSVPPPQDVTWHWTKALEP